MWTMTAAFYGFVSFVIPVHDVIPMFNETMTRSTANPRTLFSL